MSMKFKMLSKIKACMVASVLLVMFMGLSSCEHNDGEETVQFTYQYSCSPDLLEFVVPTVSYHNSDDELQEVQLDAKDFVERSNAYKPATRAFNSVNTNDESFKVWRFRKTYYGWEFKDRIIVSYSVKPDISIDESKTYTFYHGVYRLLYNIMSDDKDVRTFEKEFQIEETKLQGKDVKSYLDKLTWESECTVIDFKAHREK